VCRQQKLDDVLLLVLLDVLVDMLCYVTFMGCYNRCSGRGVWRSATHNLDSDVRAALCGKARFVNGQLHGLHVLRGTHASVPGRLRACSRQHVASISSISATVRQLVRGRCWSTTHMPRLWSYQGCTALLYCTDEVQYNTVLVFGHWSTLVNVGQTWSSRSTQLQPSTVL
jgi:hypothetical protein